MKLPTLNDTFEKAVAMRFAWVWLLVVTGFIGIAQPPIGNMTLRQHLDMLETIKLMETGGENELTQHYEIIDRMIELAEKDDPAIHDAFIMQSEIARKIHASTSEENLAQKSYWMTRQKETFQD